MSAQLTLSLDVFIPDERRIEFLSRQGSPPTRGRVVCLRGQGGAAQAITAMPPPLTVGRRRVGRRGNPCHWMGCEATLYVWLCHGLS